MAHVILDKQQNSGLVVHLRRIANGSVRVKEADSPLVSHLKAIADGKAAPAGQQAEKDSPFLPHYHGEIPPIYQAPTDRQKEQGRLNLLDRFFILNQNYGRKQ